MPSMQGPQASYPQYGGPPGASPYPPAPNASYAGYPPQQPGGGYPPGPPGASQAPYPGASAGPGPYVPGVPQTYPSHQPGMPGGGYGHHGHSPYVHIPGQGAGTLRLQLGATNLKDKDKGRDKSDPFFIITKMGVGHSGDSLVPPIHKSEVIYDNLNPLWQPFTTSVQHFCNGDYHMRIKIEIYDFDSVGRNQFLGECTTSLRELMDACPAGRRFPLIGKKFGHHSSKPAGELYVRECNVWKEQLPS